MRPISKVRMHRSGMETVVVVTGMIGAAVACALIYIWQVVQTQDLKRNILELEQRKGALIRENARLTVEINRQSGQEEIAPVAMQALRLDYPMIGQIVAISEPMAPSARVAVSEQALSASTKGRTRINPVAAVPLAPSR